MSEIQSIGSIVLAGGKGTRLFPLTLNHSKPAVPFGGKYRLIDVPLSNSINSHIDTIFVIAQFLTTELQRHIQSTYFFSPLSEGKIHFLTPQENAKGEKVWFEGTADAVRKNLELFSKTELDYFLILSGDQLYNIDFQEMFAFAKEKDADLTIAALPVEKKLAPSLGILEINEEKRIQRFVEKPQEEAKLESLKMPDELYEQLGFQDHLTPHYLASMGIYIFKRKALENLLLNESEEDFGKHLIPKEIQKGKTFAYVYKGYWEDIGTIQSFYEANLALVQGNLGLDIYDERSPIFAKPNHLPGPIVHSSSIKNTIVSDGCTIDAKEITNSIIGPRVQIGKGTIIRNSIIMGIHDPSSIQASLSITKIGENCLIENTIIDEHVTIGDAVRLHVEKTASNRDGEGVFIREGIIIVTKDTTLANEFTL